MQTSNTPCIKLAHVSQASSSSHVDLVTRAILRLPTFFIFFQESVMGSIRPEWDALPKMVVVNQLELIQEVNQPGVVQDQMLECFSVPFRAGRLRRAPLFV